MGNATSNEKVCVKCRYSWEVFTEIYNENNQLCTFCESRFVHFKCTRCDVVYDEKAFLNIGEYIYETEKEKETRPRPPLEYLHGRYYCIKCYYYISRMDSKERVLQMPRCYALKGHSM